MRVDEKDDLLDIIKCRWMDGDSCVEIAENWKDDDDVARLLPELKKVLERLDAAASELVAMIDK